MTPKISIIGAGAVGAQAASLIAQRGFSDVVLIDILADMAKGKALDIVQSLPLFSSTVSVVGGDDYALTEHSAVVVIVAGIARKPGMTREQLLETNAEIVADVTRKAVVCSPDAILIVITNPLDAMTYLVKEVSGFARERVIGMAGVLDSARFRHFLAREAHVSVDKVEALVMGSHGGEMVPLERLATINGKSAISVIGNKRMELVIDHVKTAGAKIVGLLQTGSAYYAPGAAIAEMVESILKDQKKVLPCSVCLEGEYGVYDCSIGVPVVLGKKGVEKIVEIELTEDEKEKFKKSVEIITQLISHAEKHFR